MFKLTFRTSYVSDQIKPPFMQGICRARFVFCIFILFFLGMYRNTSLKALPKPSVPRDQTVSGKGQVSCSFLNGKSNKFFIQQWKREKEKLECYFLKPTLIRKCNYWGNFPVKRDTNQGNFVIGERAPLI